MTTLPVAYCPFDCGIHICGKTRVWKPFRPAFDETGDGTRYGAGMGDDTDELVLVFDLGGGTLDVA